MNIDKTYLTRLGNTKLEVADNLTKCNAKGKIGKAYHCPVSNYLKQAFGGKVMVGTHKATVIEKHLSFAVPEPVREFILDFDKGMFHTLVQ